MYSISSLPAWPLKSHEQPRNESVSSIEEAGLKVI